MLVTAGPTVEDIDPVRFLSNRSSGRMGYRIAEAARDRGASVVLVSGPTSLEPPAGVEVVRVRSAEEMQNACATRAPSATVVVAAAAVADYRPASPSATKIKKKDGLLSLELVRTPDILKGLGAGRKGAVLVGLRRGDRRRRGERRHEARRQEPRPRRGERRDARWPRLRGRDERRPRPPPGRQPRRDSARYASARWPIGSWTRCSRCAARAAPRWRGREREGRRSRRPRGLRASPPVDDAGRRAVAAGRSPPPPRSPRPRPTPCRPLPGTCGRRARRCTGRGGDPGGGRLAGRGGRSRGRPRRHPRDDRRLPPLQAERAVARRSSSARGARAPS